ncbi:TIGR00255 family protein [Desulfonatronum thiosulfatophilum]|uniref:TIGR00255 family protein n=1 Tax=Desulfonatronum thiosulfatophilum TaxID=617002 RepID=A0A1G6BYE4_9BACT|nr:YicC/YloC family endoribonuclease [Desulfonatronum thiosulfatophilum]SDB25614.1 TIGR00255 family protein [Desulfonatronum thiosulfatophilum]
MSVPTGSVRSMTGFGSSRLQNEDGVQSWEIRTINSRYLEIKWRIPGYCRRLENGWEKIVRSYLTRGRVDISLDVRLTQPDAVCPTLDITQARGMLNQMQELAKLTDLPFQPDLNQLFLHSGLWRDPSGDLSERLVDYMSQGLHAALKDVQQARLREGQTLSRDILSRLERMTDILVKIRSRTAGLVPKRMELLHERIDALIQSYNAHRDAGPLVLDEPRMLQELALLSDRLDVSEELTRLAMHLEEARRILNHVADSGRRLDFLFQECLREISTCGNKTQDAEISRDVVAFKAELEKCREQIQNLE